MTIDEAKKIFLDRGFIDGVYDGNKWREACIVISEWLEQEPTTKNDLGVDCISREFQEIVVEYPPEDLCTYPEYKGKPYFSIKYKEGNDYFIGYGTYNPEVFSRYLRDYFMPSVTPQEPKTGHWITKEAYSEDKAMGFTEQIVCSNCDMQNSYFSEWDECKNPISKTFIRSKYCPNCGAKMQEVEE